MTTSKTDSRISDLRKRIKADKASIQRAERSIWSELGVIKMFERHIVCAEIEIKNLGGEV